MEEFHVRLSPVKRNLKFFSPTQGLFSRFSGKGIFRVGSLTSRKDITIPNMGRYRISSSQMVTGSIMVVSHKVFLREAEELRRVRRSARRTFVCSVVMEQFASFSVGSGLSLSYLVPKFYKNDTADVIISVCEFLSPVVVLAKTDNLVLKSIGICDTLTASNTGQEC